MVVDASVILKWFMEEGDSELARAIKDEHVFGKITLVVPDLAIYEVGNALRYEPEFSFKEVNRALANLYELDLDIIAPLPDINELTTRIAYKNEVTFYDAFYVALAQRLGLPFITADKKLFHRLEKLPFVNLLGTRH